MSHDKQIKVWDSSTFKCKTTMRGHEKGVWSINYEPKTGAKFATASPDSFVKLWDVKSGKCTDTLNGHTHFCYRAVFSNDGLNLASVGADSVVNYWDLRNTRNPVFQNKENKNCLLNCDFMPSDQQIVTTSIEGEISMFSVKQQKRVFHHETLPALIQTIHDAKVKSTADEDVDLNKIIKETSNIIFGCYTAKAENRHGYVLIGDQQGDISKIKVDYNKTEVESYLSGHSGAVRALEMNKEGSKIISCCADHSLRIWDFDSGKAQTILCGHQDVVVSTLSELITLLDIDWRQLHQRKHPGECFVGLQDYGLEGLRQWALPLGVRLMQ